MELIIDGRRAEAMPDESLQAVLTRVGLASEDFLRMPLAAKIAGEVFNLNYVPLRQKDTNSERGSIRTAMAASGGVVQLLRITDPSGWEVYARTAQFMLFLAIGQLWPGETAKMGCTLGPALFIRMHGATEASADALRRRLLELVRADIPLVRSRMTTAQAAEAFRAMGNTDKADLLQWRTAPWFDIYRVGEHADYHYGELAASTGCLRVWDLKAAEGGFLFIFPDRNDPRRVGSYENMPNFFSVFSEGDRWGQLMECETVSDLNRLTVSGGIRELIRVNEALHEKRYAQVADAVCHRGCRAVMLAGPSSSGKTTSANRLATQLRVHGKKPLLMSLDDYYIDRDKCPRDENGQLDLEHINTIDTGLFGRHLQLLLSGSAVEIPSFNFKTGKREWKGNRMQLSRDSVVIVEGLHALNPVLLPPQLDKSLVFRLYVSPLLPLNLDDHNRIPTSYLRLLRRTVRDYETRGSSVQQTMAMWDSVRRGEARWIFPYQEHADVIFNSSMLYELAVLKKHIYPLLTAIGPEETCYEQVRGMVKVLNYVLDADVDDEIPPTSLVREFIGGNSFYK